MPDIDELENAVLRDLEARFMRALTAKDAGNLDSAEDDLRGVLETEPRLPEPRLELARILLDTDRLEEAEEHARQALAALDAGGQWTDELPEEIILAMAHALLAEILRRRADDDDVIFGDADRFRRIVAESREHFARAAELDPSDEYASYHSFFLGTQGHGSTEPRGEAD